MRLSPRPLFLLPGLFLLVSTVAAQNSAPTLPSTLEYVLDEHIPKELLSSDGNWSPLDIKDAVAAFNQKMKGKEFKLHAEMRIASIGIGKVSTAGKKTTNVVRLAGHVTLKGANKFKFRGKSIGVSLTTGNSDDQGSIVLLPISLKPILQKALPGWQANLELTATCTFNGSAVVWNARPGPEKITLTELIPKK
jgi:hypothetical protein